MTYLLTTNQKLSLLLIIVHLAKMVTIENCKTAISGIIPGKERSWKNPKPVQWLIMTLSQGNDLSLNYDFFRGMGVLSSPLNLDNFGKQRLPIKM